jgi:hypothetical protein
MFFGNPPKMNDFHIALINILDNIFEVEKILKKNRTYE